jgi:ABC-2 type transport system ATP-binding protein
VSVVVSAQGLSRRFGGTVALDGVSFTLRRDVIYGLLGRNGAGKTTLMQILTGQQFASSGEVEVMGAAPYENDGVLANICFVRESQRYPDQFRVRHALRAASLLFPNWDKAYAEALVEDFRLPRSSRVAKLSRGMLSALGVVIGLASRAPLTFFDEPYLGLDAVARQLFYDRLLADYVEHPRTVVLSTHLIDEVADLVEHVLLLDRGRLVVNDATDRLRGQVLTVTGPSSGVDAFSAALADRTAGRTADRVPLHRSTLGPMTRATVRGVVDADTRATAERLGVQVEPVSLQQLVVSLTSGTAEPTPEESIR